MVKETWSRLRSGLFLELKEEIETRVHPKTQIFRMKESQEVNRQNPTYTHNMTQWKRVVNMTGETGTNMVKKKEKIEKQVIRWRERYQLPIM